MSLDHHARAGSAPADPSGLVAFVEALRGIGDLEPASVPALLDLKRRGAQPVRLSYSREDATLVLHARRALAGPEDEAVECARVDVPEWLVAAEADAPLGEEVRRDLGELVRASFAVLEARLGEFFEFATGQDTVLVLREPGPAVLAIGPATTPSPRLQPALPSHGPEYAADGDPRQAGGARANRGTGGTGVDGTHAPDDAAAPGEHEDPGTLAGAPLAIEGTLGQALAEGSITDEDPPAASPGRLGH